MGILVVEVPFQMRLGYKVSFASETLSNWTAVHCYDWPHFLTR